MIEKPMMIELIAEIFSPLFYLSQKKQILKDVINDFIETSTTFACELAQHRGSNVVDLKDLQLYLGK